MGNVLRHATTVDPAPIWEIAVQDEGADELHVDVGPCDVVSFPPGVARRFMNITEGAAQGEEHVLLFVIAGDAPEAEFTPKAMERVREALAAE